MKIKKILLITQYFEPDITAAAFRMGDLYRNLNNREDVKLTVITTHPHKSDEEVCDSKNNINRIKLPDINKGFLLKYLIEYFYFTFLVIYKYFKLKEKYNYIIISSPPLFVGFAGYIIAKLSRAKLITDIRDLWPESIAAGKIIKKKSLTYKILSKFEKFIYKKSSYIFTVSNTMKEYIMKYNQNVEVIYNGISENEKRIKNKLDKIKISAKNPQGKLDIYYAGNIGLMQNLKYFLTAFKEDTKLKEIFNIHFIGDGPQKKELMTYRKKYNLDNVKFLGQFTKEKTLKILFKEADILLINLLDYKLFEMAIPSKLFDYLLINRPILIGLKGESRNILEKLNCAVFFENNNVNKLIKSLYFIKENYNKYLTNSKNNYDFVIKNFNRYKEFNKLYKLFDCEDDD